MVSDAGPDAPPTTPAGGPSEGHDQRTGERRSRRFGWPLGLLAAVAAIVGIGYFIVSLAPNYIARYLVRTYFQGLAIDTSGVETIDINPLRGEIRFGPVSFRGSAGEAGQVGQIRVRLDVRRLLSRQALIRSAEGVSAGRLVAAMGTMSSAVTASALAITPSGGSSESQRWSMAGPTA